MKFHPGLLKKLTHLEMFTAKKCFDRLIDGASVRENVESTEASSILLII